jgi:hypothetical protein
MRSVARALFAFAMLGIVQLAASVAPSVASAQTTNVVVLGLTSLEGDDTFATNLSGALRQAASQVRGWTVSDRDVPLSQLELATGCDATELSCVQQIANTVGAQRLVYGTIHRQDSGGGRFDFVIAIHLYDTTSNSIIRSLDERLPSSRSDIDDLREPARRYATTLAEGAGTATTGTGGLPPEGQEVGTGTGTGETGTGGGEVGGETGGGETGGGGGGDDVGRLNWPAFALLAVGVGTAVAWILAGLDAQANVTTVADFRATMPGPAPGATDLSICNPQNVNADMRLTPQERDAINGACSSPAEILQFVFMGTAIIAGATGVALLAANGFISPAPESDRVSLRLRPQVSLNGGYLGLELAF